MKRHKSSVRFRQMQKFDVQIIIYIDNKRNNVTVPRLENICH